MKNIKDLMSESVSRGKRAGRKYVVERLLPSDISVGDVLQIKWDPEYSSKDSLGIVIDGMHIYKGMMTCFGDMVTVTDIQTVSGKENFAIISVKENPFKWPIGIFEKP